MNFNIANSGSQLAAFMDTLDCYTDIADPAKVDDEKFALTLRDESKRADLAADQAADQARVEVKDRETAERSDRRDLEKSAVQSKQYRPDADIEARRSDTAQQHIDKSGADEIAGAESHGDDYSKDSIDTAKQHDPSDDQRGSQPEPDQSEQHTEADDTAGDTPGDTAGETTDLAPEQQGRADDTPDEENQHREDAPGQQATANPGQLVADAARMAVAASLNQPKAAETLMHLVNQGTPNPQQGAQTEPPINRDPLATGTLPVPLRNKPITVMNQDKNSGEGTGKNDANSPKLGQQIQALIKQPAAPHLRGGQAKHGGDIMPDTLPRPHSGQIAIGNAFGRQLANAIQSSMHSAANATSGAGIASPDGGATIQNLQLLSSPEHTGQGELPMLTVRPGGTPAPTSAVPQPLAGLPMEGEGTSGMMSLGEENGKAGGNSATSVSTASSTAASGSKAATIIQQNATADVRNPGIQVAMHLSKAVQNGIDRMTIRLDPAELGRVQVRLEVGHDGRAIAMVAAERPETLDLLQKDARTLERALQEAGLETDGNSLSFSLSHGDQQGGALADGSRNDGDNGSRTNAGNGEIDDEEAAGDGDILPQVVSNRALDISV